MPHRLLLTTLGVFLAAGATAQPVQPARTALDPLQSTECRQALAALQAQETVAASAVRAGSAADARVQGVPDAKLQGVRRRAAAACLAGRADVVPVDGRSAQPPLATATLSVPRPAAPSAVTLPPLAVPLPALPAPPRPAAILSCDAVGCWASDGSRLNRMGPNLWGAQGPCTLLGTLLQCP